jgi:hypothetical protein
MRLALDLNPRQALRIRCGSYFQQMKIDFEMGGWRQTAIHGEGQKGPLIDVNLAARLTFGNQNSI